MTSNPNTLRTSANMVTMARVVLVPVWLVLAELSVASDGLDFAPLAFFVFLFYVVLAASDGIDGYLARSKNEVTVFGKFLDPIADKLVVIVSLVFLLEEGLTQSWVLVVILAREFLVSGLRMLAANKGDVIAASWLGKIKTATTMVAIGMLLLFRSIPASGFTSFLGTGGHILMIVAVVFTIWSGIDYFVKVWPYVE